MERSRECVFHREQWEGNRERGHGRAGERGNLSDLPGDKHQREADRQCDGGHQESAEIELQDIGLAANEHLIIDHDENDFLRIRILGTNGKYRSVMSCRTDASDDDLQAGPGSKTFYVETTRAVYYVVQVRGRYQ